MLSFLRHKESPQPAKEDAHYILRGKPTYKRYPIYSQEGYDEEDRRLFARLSEEEIEARRCVEPSSWSESGLGYGYDAWGYLRDYNRVGAPEVRDYGKPDAPCITKRRDPEKTYGLITEWCNPSIDLHPR